MKKITVTACILLLCLLTLPAAWAEEPASPLTRPRIVLLFYRDRAADLTDSERQRLYTALINALAFDPAAVTLKEAPLPESGAEAADYSGLARRAGADSWIEVLLDRSGQELAARAVSFDRQGESHFDLALQRSLQLALRLPDKIFWFPLEKAARENWTPLSRVQSGGEGEGDDFARKLANRELFDYVEGETPVTIAGLPGTAVAGLSPDILHIPAGGELRLSLPKPREYSLRSDRDGYDPEDRTFFLGSDPVRIELEQSPATRWALEAGMLNLQYAGLFFSWYFVPNRFYLKGGLTTYSLGWLLDMESGGGLSLVSLPLQELYLGVGGYLNRAESLLRLYLEAGGLLRLYWDSGFSIEPLAPVKLQLVMGGEYRLGENLALYAAYTPGWYLIAGDPQLFSSLLSGNELLPALDLQGFRVGLRWRS